MPSSCPFFIFPILLGRWSGDHAQVDLGKLGYKWERKEETFRNPAIYFSNMLDLLSSSQIFQKKNPQNLVTLDHFSPKKTPLYESYWVFFCVIRMWNVALTKNPAHCSTLNLITYLLISYVHVQFDTLIQWEFLLICLKFQNNFTLTLPKN